MHVKETLNDGLRRGYEITVPGAKIESMVQEKLSDATSGFTQKGFRKGKVPSHILRKKMGRQFYNDVLIKAINDEVSELLSKTGDRPAFKPNLQFKNDLWNEGDDVFAEVYYENLPEVPAIDLKSIMIERLTFDVPEHFIDHFVNKLEELKSEIQEKSAVSTSTQLSSENLATHENADGTGAVLTKSQLSEQVTELSANEQKSDKILDNALDEGVALTDQNDSSMPDIETSRPELDDVTKKDIRQRAAQAIEAKLQSILFWDERQKIMDVLHSQCSFQIPPTLLQNESMSVARQRAADESQSDNEDNSKVIPHDSDIQVASKRLKLAYVIHALAAKSGIEVLPADFEKSVANIAVLSRMPFNQALKEIKQNDELMVQIHNEIIENKVLQYVTESVTFVETAAKEEQMFDLLFPK